MIYNKSIADEKYGTCYPFYAMTSTNPIVLCLWNHIASCTLYTPAGMLPPVRIASVAINRTDKKASIEFKDKNNSVLGTCSFSETDLSSQDDLQFAIWSPQSILLGYIEVTNPSTFLQELMTGLSGALTYQIPSKDLRILPYCTHSIQLPTPAAVHMGSDIPEYTYLGRGVLFTGSPRIGATNSLSISVYAETPIGDRKSVV